ncbi:MAG: hypothetical protein HKN27_03020 [Silicimonas sp.]|nr:hypothetical protein [Silicimonas sp.]
MFYLDVKDIDTLCETLKPVLAKLPVVCVRAPFNQDYGQRKFRVIDED